MNSNLAPIIVFVYNRPLHTKLTIEALQKNLLANKSELFIFSDAAKDEDARDNVQEVRKYIHTITGFRKVTIIEREKNYGLAKSVIEGVTEIINEYGKIIVLEDDLITSKLFLKFMNSCLFFYESENIIFTVSGYSNIKVPRSYKYNVYFAHVSTSWGWATWKNRWESINWDNKYYSLVLEDKRLLKVIKQKVGNERIRMLKQQLNQKINSWAIRRLFAQLIQNKMTVFPRITLVNNIGHDGSGVHCSPISGGVDQQNTLSNELIFDNTLVKEDPLINQLVFEKNNTVFAFKAAKKLLETIKIKVSK